MSYGPKKQTTDGGERPVAPRPRSPTLISPEHETQAIHSIAKPNASQASAQVFDYASRYPEAAAKIIEWLKEGKLKYRIDLVEGLRAAPTALNRLFDGGNIGKLLVKLSEEPA